MLLDFLLSRLIRSILTIIIGTACNVAVIWFDVTRHGALTRDSLVGILAVCAVAALAHVHQDRLGRIFRIARFRWELRKQLGRRGPGR